MRRIIKPLIWIFFISLLAFLKKPIFEFFNMEVWCPIYLVKYPSLVIEIILWISYAYLFNRILVVFVWEGLMKSNGGEALPKLLQEIAGIIIGLVTLGFIMAFVFNRSVAGLWATSGVISVVAGFALRGMLSDIFAGIAINMEKPFSIGDWIEVHGRKETLNVTGQVKEINWRTTRMLSPEKDSVIISNSNISIMTIINYSKPQNKSRFELEITLDFYVSIEQAKRILLSALKLAVETKGFCIEPKPSVLVDSLNDRGVNYKLRYWIFPWKSISPEEAKDVVMYNVIRNLHKSGIDISYPKRNVKNIGISQTHNSISKNEDRKYILSKVGLFSKLNDEELESLSIANKPEYFPEGETIISKGDSGDSLIILLEGMLEVYSDTKKNRKEIKIASLKPGDFFGEMSFFTGELRSATVKASTEVCVYKVHKEIMDKLLHVRPEIADHISNVIAKRSVDNSKMSDSLSTDKKEAETARLRRQILRKIRSFFKIF